MKRIALTGVVALSVLATAACSSGTTTSTTQGAAAGSSTQTSSKPLSTYLLQQSDIPSGYRNTAAAGCRGRGRFSHRRDEGRQGHPGVVPARPVGLRCATGALDPQGHLREHCDRAAIVTAVSTKSAGANGSVEDFRRYNLGDCSTHQITTTVGANSVTATQTATQLTVDTPGVSGALAARLETTAQIPGAPERTSEQLVALLPIPDGAVLVSVNNLAGQPDESVFPPGRGCRGEANRRLIAGLQPWRSWVVRRECHHERSSASRR